MPWLSNNGVTKFELYYNQVLSYENPSSDLLSISFPRIVSKQARVSRKFSKCGLESKSRSVSIENCGERTKRRGGREQTRDFFM